MSKIVKHYDAKGNPILDLFGMFEYYRDDLESLKVLQSKPPHLYVVQPYLMLVIDPRNPFHVWIFKVYPGGQVKVGVFLSEKAVNSLRNLYTTQRGGWKRAKKDGLIYFTKRGRVIPFSVQGYLPWKG